MPSIPDDLSKSGEQSHQPLREPREEELDHTLVPFKSADIRAAILEEALKSETPFKRITPEKFEEKLEVLLQGNIPDHLRVGLGILSGIFANDASVINSINEKDGAQMLVQLLVGYVEQNGEELDKVASMHPTLNEDMGAFIIEYQVNGKPEVLRNLYLAQLAHFAFHMIYYGYEPQDKVELDHDSPHQSFIDLTRNASIVTASLFGKSIANIQYYRIQQRDTRDPLSPLSITEEIVPVPVGTEIGEAFDLSSGSLEDGDYVKRTTFSNSRILAAKKTPISRYEEVSLESQTTNLSRSFVGRLKE